MYAKVRTFVLQTGHGCDWRKSFLWKLWRDGVVVFAVVVELVVVVEVVGVFDGEPSERLLKYKIVWGCCVRESKDKKQK
jgi:predicted acyltransferase